MVDQLVDAGGSKEMELADSISGIGIQSQRRAGMDLELLKVRMGEILSRMKQAPKPPKNWWMCG